MSISQSLRAIAIMPKSLHSQLKRFFGFKSTVTTPPTNTTEKPSPNTFSLQVEETESVTTERGSEPELEEAILADMSVANATEDNNDHLVQSSDASHPANLIPELCRKFYSLGWVTGTGGGVSRLYCPVPYTQRCLAANRSVDKMDRYQFVVETISS